MDFSWRRSKRSKREQMEVGAEAKRLMDHPLIQEFFQRAQESLYSQWCQPCNPDSSPRSIDDRELIYMQLQGLEAFKAFFHKLIVDASMAEKDLNKE